MRVAELILKFLVKPDNPIYLLEAANILDSECLKSAIREVYAYETHSDQERQEPNSEMS